MKVFFASSFPRKVAGILFILAVLVGCKSPSTSPDHPAEPAYSPTSTVNAPPASSPVSAGDAASPALSPQQVVENFYLGHIASPHQLLVDRAYAESLYLAVSFVNRLDELLGDPNEPLNADPFLLTQALPQSISFETYAVFENQARVLVHQMFGSQQVDLVVDLEFIEREWEITLIQKGNPKTPDGVVWLFYGWYLDYSHAQGSPLTDLAYQDSPYLSQAFIQRIHQQTAGQGSGVVDPLVFSSVVPDYFSPYSPVEEGERATVLMECFWKQGKEPTLLDVFLLKHEGQWQIDHVKEHSPQIASPAASEYSRDYADWNILVDEEFGFSLPYPPGWLVKPPEAFSPPLPDEGPENPLKRQYLWMPEDLYEEVLSRRFADPATLPPQSAPERVIPYVLHIYQAYRQQVEESHVPVKLSTPARFNGFPAEMRVLIDGRSIQYLFQHPYRPDVWLIFVDVLSSDVRYEAQARELTGILELMLGGIQFVE